MCPNKCWKQTRNTNQQYTPTTYTIYTNDKIYTDLALDTTLTKFNNKTITITRTARDYDITKYFQLTLRYKLTHIIMNNNTITINKLLKTFKSQKRNTKITFTITVRQTQFQEIQMKIVHDIANKKHSHQKYLKTCTPAQLFRLISYANDIKDINERQRATNKLYNTLKERHNIHKRFQNTITYPYSHLINKSDILNHIKSLTKYTHIDDKTKNYINKTLRIVNTNHPSIQKMLCNNITKSKTFTQDIKPPCMNHPK